MRDKIPSTLLRVHLNFKDLTYDYIKQFKEKYGIEISTTEATKKISEKIEDAGGLIV